MDLNTSLTSKKLDEEFVACMLQVENRYKVHPKHERIRIENWVSGILTLNTGSIEQSSLPSDDKCCVEEKS